MDGLSKTVESEIQEQNRWDLKFVSRNSRLISCTRMKIERNPDFSNPRFFEPSDLFLILDLFIFHERSEGVIFERRSREGERKRCKWREVDLFHLQGCESGRTAKHMIDISHFPCAPRAIVAKAENHCNQNVYEYCSLTQMNLFVYIAVYNQQTKGESCSVE